MGKDCGAHLKPPFTAMHLSGRQQANWCSGQTQGHSIGHIQALRTSLDPISGIIGLKINAILLQKHFILFF